jgi:hypothetical protein
MNTSAHGRLLAVNVCLRFHSSCVAKSLKNKAASKATDVPSNSWSQTFEVLHPVRFERELQNVVGGTRKCALKLLASRRAV